MEDQTVRDVEDLEESEGEQDLLSAVHLELTRNLSQLKSLATLVSTAQTLPNSSKQVFSSNRLGHIEISSTNHSQKPPQDQRPY